MIAPAVRRSSDEPWTVGEVTQALVLQSVAIGLVVVAWYGASGAGDPNDQLSWLCLGVLAVVVCGGTNATVLLSGSRALKARRVAATRLFEQAFTSTSPLATRPAAVAELRAVEGAERFHRADCRLIAGRDPLVGGDARDHAGAGRAPCGWCEP